VPKEIKCDLELDLRGKLCPVPKDTVMENIGKVAVGSVLKATTTDPHSLDCIPAWVKVMGNEVLKIDRNNGEFVFYVKRLK
jgi:tRNA 2-thiouridine synthesizing protein A